MKKIIPSCLRREAGVCALALLLTTALLPGCGYHFAAEGTALPAQSRTIYVEKFGNHSRFTGIDDQFMRYLKDEIANHGRLQVVDDPAQADLLLSGELRYIFTAPVATNGVSEPIEYLQTILANATLVDQHTHKLVWSGGGISATQQYGTVATAVVTTSPEFLQQNLRSQDIASLPDIQVAKTQQDFSDQLLLQNLAQNVYVSMTEGF